MLHIGCTIESLTAAARATANGHTPCPLVKRLIDERLEIVRQEMRDAQMLLKRMQSASGVWSEPLPVTVSAIS